MAGYIGNTPIPEATQTRDNFTATSGQTTFATSGYTPGYLDVYLNGVHLEPSDYTATNGSDVVLNTGATTGDNLTVVAWTTFNVTTIYANDLVDVDTSGITNGQTLLYNSTSSQFEAGDVDALPSQTGESGNYLTTDGSTASWAALDTDANTTTKGLYEHAHTISANYTITSGNNAMSAGPVTIDTGYSVTVPSGSVWTIV